VYTSNKPRQTPCACTTVKKVSRVLGRAYDKALASAGINNTQLTVLRCIARRSGEPLARLADELEMERTTLYRAVTPMARDGWVTLADGPDARSRTAALTKKGEQLLARANDGWDETQSRIVAAFGEQQWNKLVKDLNRLALAAESAAP
jgi:DNA-binding MarR family transcriptional regulator